MLIKLYNKEMLLHSRNPEWMTDVQSGPTIAVAFISSAITIGSLPSTPTSRLLTTWKLSLLIQILSNEIDEHRKSRVAFLLSRREGVLQQLLQKFSVMDLWQSSVLSESWLCRQLNYQHKIGVTWAYQKRTGIFKIIAVLSNFNFLLQISLAKGMFSKSQCIVDDASKWEDIHSTCLQVVFIIL